MRLHSAIKRTVKLLLSWYQFCRQTIFARSILSRNGKKASEASATLDNFLIHSLFSKSVRNLGTSSNLRNESDQKRNSTSNYNTHIDWKKSSGMSFPTVPFTKLSIAFDISALFTPFLNFIDVTVGCCLNHLEYEF